MFVIDLLNHRTRVKRIEKKYKVTAVNTRKTIYFQLIVGYQLVKESYS